MDWRVKTDSQAFVVRMQQPRLLVVLDFLLAVGEYFVPALGIITGREEVMDIQNDPVTMHDHVRLNASLYEQKEDIVFLSPHRQLIADSYDVDEFTYDGCGNTICLIGKDNLKGNSSPSLQPLIIIGYGKKLRFKNIRIKVHAMFFMLCQNTLVILELVNSLFISSHSMLITVFIHLCM